MAKKLDAALAVLGDSLVELAVIRAARARVGRCQFEEQAEPEVGWTGTPPCRLSELQRDEWCGPCVERERLYQPMREMRRARANARRRVEGFAVRAAERRKGP
ncbi:MAG: hypothetical protein IT181_13045 [Acidobacteria bacterium]|nr:hypothetical protein [Acidobacteriota bacterium]